MDRLFADIRFMKGVGPVKSRQLHRLGIHSIFDLLWYAPRSYFNRNATTAINEAIADNTLSIKGKVTATRCNNSARGVKIFKALVADKTGSIAAVWFNQPFLAALIKPGQEVFLSGKVKKNFGTLEIRVNYYEVLEDETDLRIIPTYPLTEGLTQRSLRKLVAFALDNYLCFYPDIMNAELKEKYDLCDITFAFNQFHFPRDRESYLRARARLAFEELYLFQLSLAKKRDRYKENKFVVHQAQTELVSKIMARLPYKLTTGQQQAVREIFTDMEKPVQMNRLLQGDVGSGKTIVAVLAMAKAVGSGYQAAIMAPTEILADQHFTSISRFFDGTGVIIAKLTGRTYGSNRSALVEGLAQGKVDILVGTHAILQEGIDFARLGLAVIDEQHRFGVHQRAILSNKGVFPDVLVMSATPIPRTLALTVYGDLDLSVISELPPGRKPVQTVVIKKSGRKRAYESLKKEIQKGSQAYVVCPLVEESEKLDLQAATVLYRELAEKIMPEFRVGLLHGRMKSQDKAEIMNKFKQHQIDVLVATTVVEVGVDVANASIMVVEQAERFGLSQLHQLRGRVGRGDKQSYCVLIGNPRNPESIRRLQAMAKTADGFEIAHEDLLIRGMGDFWGVRQHGLNQLKVADLIRDRRLVEITRQAALQIGPGGDSSELDLYIKNKFKATDEIASN